MPCTFIFCNFHVLSAFSNIILKDFFGEYDPSYTRKNSNIILKDFYGEYDLSYIRKYLMVLVAVICLLVLFQPSC